MLGDCIERLKSLEDNSVDSVVTDPPYGLKFMNKHWDYNVPSVRQWQEILRVLKPGGYLLSFGGTRTYHRMVVNVEDAGFEIRDTIAWVYGSGFPKSHAIGKAIDKVQGNERVVVRLHERQNYKKSGAGFIQLGSDELKTDYYVDKGTSEWEGWGTALKPAMELITLARKPLSEKTIAKNVLKWGTGGININGCRVGSEKRQSYEVSGRFPANLIHDGSDEVLSVFPEAKGQQGDLKNAKGDRESPNGIFGKMNSAMDHPKREETNKSASRFFYCAKTSQKERTMDGQIENKHPTVKPVNLMKYLVRLVTPKKGIVLDPFMGSGSTGHASILERFNFIGIEKDNDSFKIAKNKIKIVLNDIRVGDDDAI